MPEFAPPLSVSITAEQLAWLDASRCNGSLSRSAALRLALDQLMEIEAFRASPSWQRHRQIVDSICSEEELAAMEAGRLAGRKA